MENKKFVILDGGMGTMLQAAGMPMGATPEVWNITHFDDVVKIQKSYIDAGSNVIYTNTFGANRLKLERCGYSVSEIVGAAVAVAREAAKGSDARVALDIGPIGQMLAPLGTLSFDEAYDIFREIVEAGKAAGADLTVVETMSDLNETKAAVLAVKENSDMPVWATMTVEESGRTFVGTTVSAMALTLEGLGADAIGFNCSLGPKALMPMVEELSRWTRLPIILKPNAGLPDPATGAYDMTPEEFALEMVTASELGVSVIGGCCGTNPDFIAALAKTFEGRTPVERCGKILEGVCSGTCTAMLDGVRVIGERINPTGKKRFQQALRENDMDYIMQRAIEQQDAGAQILDVNVGLPGIDEPMMMKQVVLALQTVTDLPLQIDSSDPAAIEAGLRYTCGKAIVNSVNGEAEVMDKILPLCKKYGAAVVGLAMDKGGIPQTAGKRIEIAERILNTALGYGIDSKDVYIDCLTLTVSAQQEQAAETLKALRYVSKKLGLHTVLGVSNISFGLPEREHVTVNFLTQAMSNGLDLPIINPNQKAIMDAVSAFRVLSGEDKNCEKYIERFVNAEKTEPAAAAQPSGMNLETAIAKGLKEETAVQTTKALETMSELEVINQLLIPALDKVGERYEKQQIFLPQLINSANAACEGFEIIKKRIAKNGGDSVSKGKIILATVQGDIHDIGKNIVKVVLENYGYNVIDLGRDVAPEAVVEAAIKENVYLIGLSALMTTTVSSMAKTIKALRDSGHDCKVMVGGAVLTPDYAEEIGADFYSKDAKQSADIARKVLG